MRIACASIALAPGTEQAITSTFRLARRNRAVRFRLTPVRALPLMTSIIRGKDVLEPLLTRPALLSSWASSSLTGLRSGSTLSGTVREITHPSPLGEITELDDRQAIELGEVEWLPSLAMLVSFPDELPVGSRPDAPTRLIRYLARAGVSQSHRPWPELPTRTGLRRWGSRRDLFVLHELLTA